MSGSRFQKKNAIPFPSENRNRGTFVWVPIACVRCDQVAAWSPVGGSPSHEVIVWCNRCKREDDRRYVPPEPIRRARQDTLED